MDYKKDDIINEFREELHKRLQELGIPPETYTLITDENIDDTSDPHTLELEYKTIVEQGDYLPQRVLIEIGARSLLEPSEERTIKSIINEVYDTQKFVMDPFKVNVVIPTRTFLEKAFLLHEEFLKPTEKIRYDRLTRHLYDLERLMDHPFGLEAIKDKE